MDGLPIEDGCVAIHGDRISAVGSPEELGWRARHDIDLGDMVLMPGLINSHCHLDYTMMRHAISPPKSFSAWVQRINSLKRSLDRSDYIDAIARGFEALVRYGTTSVCNIESFPELMPEIASAPIRTWWFYEMIDIRHRSTTEEVVLGALSFFKKQPPSLARYGLSPHAPYTASSELYRLANSCASKFGMPRTTHLAESREEAQMFERASGELYDFMRSLDRPMGDCGRGSPFRQLWETGAIDSDWLLVHMNELSESDFDLIGSLAVRTLHVIHCPGSHAYFKHSPFQYERLHKLGVNISVGTDSLASTHSLSLFDELRLLRDSQPWLSADQLLRTVTVNPAMALGFGGSLGQISPHALADLIALPIVGDSRTICGKIVDFQERVPWVMVDGKVHTN